MKKSIGIVLVLMVALLTMATATTKCKQTLNKLNDVEYKLIDLESNMPLTGKLEKQHDKLLIKYQNLQVKYENCIIKCSKKQGTLCN